MKEDIIYAIVLLTVALIAMAAKKHPCASPQYMIARTQNFFLIKKVIFLHVRQNKLLQILILLIFVVITGWCSTIFRFGLEDTARAVNFQQTSHHEIKKCHMNQSISALNIELEADMLDIKLRPGLLDDRLHYVCPYNGSYAINPEGIMTCSIHGSPKHITPIRLHQGKEY